MENKAKATEAIKAPEALTLQALTQANTTLKANNQRLSFTLNAINTKLVESDFPEKITLTYILRNWRKIGEFIEAVIILLNNTLQK